MKTKLEKIKCHWCGRFLSKETRQATIKEPKIFYCPDCYKKGLDMENEAMGLCDEQNYTNEQNNRLVEINEIPF